MGRHKTNLKGKIYDAYIELLEDAEGVEDNVSITDICDRAFVSRVSYYRAYNNKKEIIRDHLDSYMEEYHRNNPLSKDMSLNEILYHILNVAYDNQRLIRLLYKKDVVRKEIFLDNEYHDKLTKSISSIGANPKSYENTFYMGAVIAVINKWVNNECKEPLEEILSMLIEHVSRPN